MAILRKWQIWQDWLRHVKDMGHLIICIFGEVTLETDCLD